MLPAIAMTIRDRTPDPEERTTILLISRSTTGTFTGVAGNETVSSCNAA